ncbi:MAG: hypothetical protein JW841_09380 [Deltaproteobacteria bacterium]|nr:hypothetical protein [Deltaproteobacteria bacterium]
MIVPIPDKGVVILYDADKLEDIVELFLSINKTNSSFTQDMVVAKKRNGYVILALGDVLYFKRHATYI